MSRHTVDDKVIHNHIKSTATVFLTRKNFYFKVIFRSSLKYYGLLKPVQAIAFERKTNELEIILHILITACKSHSGLEQVWYMVIDITEHIRTCL